ncbi:uncharacterized protein EDB91DRAFT_1135149 [Suillus paluster]|uniref:uncharacterized protein n=1 Tax=Suillus paluster TaxID=48578 RepID=UPI001B885F03|nr:uncharacterized protein EDB91DRAFT_1135149 [Suillus paluster]KAG1739431.1 hypothetical protein EDB91DRAFT_1135149 [Suillus paluster]
MDKMVYSADDIAAARSLQTHTMRLFLVSSTAISNSVPSMRCQYLYTSMATFWTYDYVCSLHQEWMFLLLSRWSRVKGFYVAARYVPFLLFTANLYLNFIPNKSTDECQTLNTACACFSMISAVSSECISSSSATYLRF